MGCHLPSLTCRTYGTRDKQNPNLGVSWGRPYVVEERSYREAALGLGRVRVCESTVHYPRPSNTWKKYAASGHTSKTLIFGVSWGRPYVVEERSYREAGLGLGRVRVCESTVHYPRLSDTWKNMPLQGTHPKP